MTLPDPILRHLPHLPRLQPIQEPRDACPTVLRHTEQNPSVKWRLFHSSGWEAALQQHLIWHPSPCIARAQF